MRRSKRKRYEGTIKTRNSAQKQVPERVERKESQTRSVLAPDKTKRSRPEVNSTNADKNRKEIVKIPSEQLQSKPSVRKLNLATVDVRIKKSKPLQEPTGKVLNDSPPQMSAFSKKSPSKIRFGYNSTTSKVPEMRPIKRRQLRQTTSRTETTAANPPLSDVSSSTDDEMPISMKTGTASKISRIGDAEKPIPVLLQSLALQPTTSTQKPEVQVTSGKGLKMVFRRQSVETALLQRNHPEHNGSTNTNVKDDVFVSGKKHDVKVKKFAKKVASETMQKRKLEYKTSTGSNSAEGDSPLSVADGLDENRPTGEAFAQFLIMKYQPCGLTCGLTEQAKLEKSSVRSLNF